MGVAGNVRVHFKIGKKCSFTHNFVVCKRLSQPFIIGEDFMRKHYMSLQWVPENKCALGFQGETIAVTSQAVLDEPLRLKNTIRIPLEALLWPQVTVTKCSVARQQRCLVQS